LERELDRAIALAGEHLSVYQLTSSRTAFAPRTHAAISCCPTRRRSPRLRDDRGAARGAGLPAYEISNHARPAPSAAQSRLLALYGDYVGVGRAPWHGSRSKASGWHPPARAPETWLETVERRGHGGDEPVALTPQEQRDELLMMGLRLAEGIPRERLRERLGLDFETALDPARLAPLVEAGFSS